MGLLIPLVALLCLATTPAPAPAPEIAWRPIEGGSFRMGSLSGRPDEQPVHRVTIEPFAIARTETTVAQYRTCVVAGVCRAPLLEWDAVSDLGAFYNWGAPGRDQHPMNGVSWRDAVLFCSWAGGRLPSEAEWEWAARGAEARTWPWGEKAVRGGGEPLANLADESARKAKRSWTIVIGYDDGAVGTAPVASYPAGATPAGVHDLAGNVWEWVANRYTPDYQSPPPPANRSQRVARGGSYISTPQMARSATRYPVAPALALDGVGFRCARDEERE